jgi:chromosome segregation ATPase
MSSFAKYLEQSLSALEDDMADVGELSRFEAVAKPPPPAAKAAASAAGASVRRSKDLSNLNAQLLAMGCRPLFETSSISDELLTCISELMLVAKQAAHAGDGFDGVAGAGGGLESELRALRLDKKTLTANVKQLTATLEAERVTGKNREKAAAGAVERLSAERDEAMRQNALLKSREEQWTRELKRRDLESAQLRERLRKLLDGVAASSETTSSHADIVGDVRHTPMKNRAAEQMLSGASVALQRQLAEAQVEVLTLKGERNALRDELRESRK